MIEPLIYTLLFGGGLLLAYRTIRRDVQGSADPMLHRFTTFLFSVGVIIESLLVIAVMTTT